MSDPVTDLREAADKAVDATTRLHHDEEACPDVCNAVAYVCNLAGRVCAEVEQLRVENSALQDNLRAEREARYEWRAEDKAEVDRLRNALHASEALGHCWEIDRDPWECPHFPTREAAEAERSDYLAENEHEDGPIRQLPYVCERYWDEDYGDEMHRPPLHSQHVEESAAWCQCDSCGHSHLVATPSECDNEAHRPVINDAVDSTARGDDDAFLALPHRTQIIVSDLRSWHRGVCNNICCGWAGPWRDSREDAIVDATMHAIRKSEPRTERES